MLKKIVKYGNSSALILDKAILELLNMGEGSVVKIKTDGKSIIITPQEKAESDKINETFTHTEASMEVMTKEYLKRYKNLDENRKEAISKELSNIYTQLGNLNLKMASNSDFKAEVEKLHKNYSPFSVEYMQAYNLLKAKYSPELLELESKLYNFDKDNQLSVSEEYRPIEKVDDTLMTQMTKEFAEVHKKYADVYSRHAKLQDDSDYQHKQQLIAEQYKDNKNSAEYFQAMNELLTKYEPEYVKAMEELKAVSEKYCKNSK